MKRFIPTLQRLEQREGPATLSPDSALAYLKPSEPLLARAASHELDQPASGGNQGQHDSHDIILILGLNASIDLGTSVHSTAAAAATHVPPHLFAPPQPQPPVRVLVG